MAIHNFIILTTTQLAHARTLDDDGNYQIGGRPIDNISPGIGLNINPDATGFVAGAPVTLVGAFVVPKRMIDDPDCATYAPDLIPYLLTLPWAMLEAETVFAPQEV